MNKNNELLEFQDEQFVPYDLALKFKGWYFNSFCFGYYSNGVFKGVDKWNKDLNGLHIINYNDVANKVDEIVLAPLYQQAFEFFRTKFGLNAKIDYWDFGDSNFTGWYYTIHKDNQKNVIYVGSVVENSSTYREAEIKTINKMFELINKNENNS